MKKLHLDTMQNYVDLASWIEMFLQKLLEDQNYNTVDNFLTFYNSFKTSKTSHESLMEFFQSYTPPITSNHYTCVGLALELWNRLRSSLPELGKHLCLVSCEENIESLSDYTSLTDDLHSSSTLEKEHVLLCLRFQVEGRAGLLLCDPGYHVARVVTVMQDKLYPNTGWFIQSNENKIRKEYNYQFYHLNEKFVEWNERTTKDSKQEIFTGLVYVDRPYVTSVDVTERRNLVYTFRSLLSRDQKGHLIAGIYFKVMQNADEFTIFYQDMGKQRVKMNFSAFSRQCQIEEELVKKISICNEQLNLAPGSLLEIIQSSAKLFEDKNFLQELLDIEQCINSISANN